MELPLEQILVAVADIQLGGHGVSQGYWLRTEVEQVSMPTAIEHGSAGPKASGNVVVHVPKPKSYEPTSEWGCGVSALPPFSCSVVAPPFLGIAKWVTGQPSSAKLGPSGEVVVTQPGWPSRVPCGGVPEVMSFPLDDGQAGP